MSLQTGMVLAARLRGFTALSPKPVIVAPDHKTLAILTYDSAILTPHTHNSFKRLFWVFHHSHVPLIQSPSTTIQAWRLGFLFWMLTVLDSYQTGQCAVFCLILGPLCFSDLFLPPSPWSGIFMSHPCQDLKAKAKLYICRYMEQTHRLKGVPDTKHPYMEKQPHRCGQDGHLHPLLASFSLFSYYLSWYGLS